MLIKFSPFWARTLIAPRERNDDKDDEVFSYLENEIEGGRWDRVKPVWLTPNLFINDTGLLDRIFIGGLPSRGIKPFIIYNGHHRWEKSIKHGLYLRAYIRYTPGNPPIPGEERLIPDVFV